MSGWARLALVLTWLVGLVVIADGDYSFFAVLGGIGAGFFLNGDD